MQSMPALADADVTFATQLLFRYFNNVLLSFFKKYNEQ